MKTLKELLIEFDAHIQIQDWAEDKTIEEVVKECHNGDWLLFLGKKLELPERKLISCKGHIMNTVRHLMKNKRGIECVDLCMKFEDESVSFEELGNAPKEAYSAYWAVIVGNDGCTLKELKTTDIVRERLGQDIINKVNQLLNN